MWFRVAESPDPQVLPTKPSSAPQLVGKSSLSSFFFSYFTFFCSACQLHNVQTRQCVRVCLSLCCKCVCSPAPPSVLHCDSLPDPHSQTKPGQQVALCFSLRVCCCTIFLICYIRKICVNRFTVHAERNSKNDSSESPSADWPLRRPPSGGREAPLASCYLCHQMFTFTRSKAAFELFFFLPQLQQPFIFECPAYSPGESTRH